MAKKSVFKNPAAKGPLPKWVGAEFAAPVSEVPYNLDSSDRPDRGVIDDHLFEDDLDDPIDRVDDEG